MCDCFHIAFPNWHAASSGAGPGRRLRGPEPGTEDNSICDEASQFTEGERPRPQGSSPVEDFPESDKYGDSDKECEAEHDPYQKSGKKTKKSGLGSIFDKRSTPKMSKLKEAPSPEAGVIVKTAKDGGAEGLVYSGGGKDGIFIKEVVPESPAFKNLHLKEGDQVLSATVYFDNIPYEDAVQILEHAQAYKVKLCLKRKPEITETEGAIDSDAIPEDEVYPPEMREPGKKRRGDARISWPKFPTLGRGKKSRFTRSHSSSEADEQRKLELSPTTSDTESPIKSQDALKGKKKHKIKLPGMKRGRISSSEDTDAQNIQTEEMISPECLESPLKEKHDIEDELKKVDKSETETHKVELVCLDSTLKTTDITAVLMEQETPSTTASPDGKKKKKERSELKLKLLGRDKKHKAKSSPKRLKTLGASLDKTDENEKSDAVASSETKNVTTDADIPKMSSSKSSQMELRLPKVEIDISDVGIICKSTHDKKGKGTEEKQSKTGFKIPKVGLGDVPTEEIIKIDASVDELKIKEKDFSYDRLLKGTELPKREDIEIPGMEDVSKITKDYKKPRAPVATIPEAGLQAETVQLSIDVNSVKEAVSKLPGYKLPKVDMSGVLIPEEITVIDANAQRISVKTPTKGKHESKSAFTEISKTTFKLPNVTADVRGGEIISETKVGVKKLELDDVPISTRAIISHTIEVEKVQKESITFSSESVETPKELDIKIKKPKVTLPDFSISKPDIKIPDFKMDLTKSSEKKEMKVQGERTIFLQEDKNVGMPNVGISMPRVKGGKVDVTVPEVEVDEPKLEIKLQQTESDKDATFGIKLKRPGISLSKKDIDVSLPVVKVGGVEPKITEPTSEMEAEAGKFKLPKLDLKMPQIKGPELDVSISKNDIDVTLPDVKAKVVLPDAPAADVTFGDMKSSIPEQKLDGKKAEFDVKVPSVEGDIEGKGGKFKMPKLGVKLPKVKGPEFDINVSKKDGEGTLPKGKIEVELPDTPDFSSPEKKLKTEFDGQGGKFKMPKLGITMPKIKGPEIDLNLSKKDVEGTVPDIKADIKVPDLKAKEPSAGVDVYTPEIGDVKLKADVEMDAKGGKFKMPKFGISMPKVKGPEIDLHLSKKDKDVKPIDLKAEMKVPEVDITVGKVDIPEAKLKIAKPSVEIKPFEAKLDIKTPEVKSLEADAQLEGQSGKFKIPRFTVAIPNVKGPDVDSSSHKKDIDIALPEAKIEVELPKAPKVEVEVKSPEYDADLHGQSGKFKMPKFGIKLPKGPEIDISLPKKEVKSPEIKADIKLPEVPKVDVCFGELDVKVPEAKFEVEKSDAPDLDVKPPSGKIKIKAPDIDVSDSPSKFKMPSLGFSVPKKDVKIPEAKAEVTLPEVESKEISGRIDVKEPEVEVSARGSPLKFKMPTFKLPKFGGSIEEKDSEIKIEGEDVTVTVPQTNVDLPDVKAEIHLPETEVKAPSGEVVIDQPSGLEIDAKFKKPRFSLPRFSFSKQSVPAPEVDVSAPEVNIPHTEGEVKADIEAPDFETPADGQGSKFKLPKFGITMPKISAPEIDLSLSKKDVEVTLPEAKDEGQLPDVDVKAPSIEAPEIKVETKTKEGSPSKLKMPTFKLPRIGISIPEAEIKVDGAEVTVPQVDVDLPDVKAEVNLPEVEIKAPSGELEIEQPSGLEMDAKFKKPRFSLPRFSFSKQSVSAPEVDISAPEVNIPHTEGKVEVKGKIDVKAPEVEAEIDGQGNKFKLPKFGITMPKISAPDIDLSLSKKDVEVTLPEANVEGKLPDVEVKGPLIEAEMKAPEIKVESKTKEGSPSKLKMPTFKFPKFGASIPEAEIKVDGAEVTVPQVDVDLPDIKANINLPEVEMKAPSGEVVIEQPSGLEFDAKFKKPRFSLPRFSFSKQSVSAPEVDISAPEVTIPQTEGKVEVKGEMDIKPPEFEAQIDGQESKFKLPKFGITMPKISAPELDLSLSKKDVEVTLPEAKAEGQLPNVEVKAPSIEAEIKAPEIKVETKAKEGSPSKLKMPTFKLPKFGASIPEAEIKVDGAEVTVPQVDVPDIKAEVNLPEVEIKAPSGELEIEKPSGLELDAKFKKPRFSLPRFSFSKQSVPAPDVDISAPEVNIPQTKGKVEVKGEIDVKSPEFEAQLDGQESKFKLPKFGITMPKISAPDIDLSLSKKDVEVTLPEAKVEGKLPEVEVKSPSFEAEIKAPEIKVETKTKEGSPSKLKMPTFKLPKFGISIPEAEIKVDGAEVTVPQVDVDLPDIKAEVNLPEVEIKAPSAELEIEKPSGLEMDAKFKKPRFSLPRFSFSKQSVPAPEVDISAPEVNIPQTEGKVEVKGEIDVKAPQIEAEIDGQGSKFKLPKFGITMPKISAPELDLSLSKKDVEVTLPEAKAEGQLPDVEVKSPSFEAKIKAPEVKVETKTKEGSPSKLKMPTFKLPKFGASIPEAEIKVDGGEVTVPQVDVDLPDIKAEVNLPEVEIKAPSGELEIEQPSGLEFDAKFKKPRFSLPRFSFSKQSVPAPEVDISAPEVTIPQTEGKVEVKGEMDIKPPEFEAKIDGQESKFKLPKFGIKMPKISAPELDLSLSKKDVEVTLPEAKAEGQLPNVEVKAPSIEAEIKAPEIKVETKTKEGSPSKLKMPTFKLPKFGASIPEAEIKVDGAEVTVPQVNVDLPDVKAEVHLPEVGIKAPSGELEIEQPSGLEFDTKFKKPRFSLPRFSFSKQSVPAPEVDISAPEVNIPQTEGKVEVKGEIDVKAPQIEAEIDGQGSKFKLPKFGITMPKISAPDIDLSLSKKDVEVTLPEAKVEGKLPDVEVKAPSIEAEIKAPEVKVETKTKEGSPSKLKMPTFKLPKFGASIPEAEIKVDGGEVTVPQVDVDLPDIKAEVNLPEVEIKAPSGELEIEQPSGLEFDAKFKKPRFSLPRFSFSKQSVPAPEVDISAPEVNIPQTEGKVEVKGEIDVKAPQIEAEIDGQGSKFKLPKFGIAMPKISAPELDLSLSKKDVEVTLPEAKVEGKLPNVKVKAPSIEAEIQAPEVKVESKSKEGSPSKLKMPTFKFPKFGASIPEAEIKADGAEVTVPQVDVDLPDIKAEVNLPEVEIKAPSGDVVIEQPSGLEMDAKFKKPRFSLPRFSFSKQSVPAPEVDIDAPEDNIEIKGEIDVKSPGLDANIDGQESKFKLPKFGITMPKISTPETDLSLSKKKVEATLSDGVDIKADIPEEVLIVQVDSSSVDIKVSEPEGKRGKFKFPSLGFSTPGTDVTQKDVELPDVEIKNIQANVDVKTTDMVESNLDESPSKFKMPSFKLPKFGATAEIDGATPEVDVNISKDGQYEKSEVKLSPDKKSLASAVEGQQTSEIDIKLKKPRFSLPKISFGKTSVDTEAEVSRPEVDASLPAITMEIKQTEREQSIEDELGTQESKFKMPKFGMSMPKVKGPEIDLSLSKKDANINSPEAKIGTTLPEAEESEVSLEAIQKESSWSFPRFSFSKPAVNVTVDSEVEVKNDLKEEASPKHEVKKHVNEEDSPAAEPEMKARFSLPRFSFSKASAKEPTIPENTIAVEVSLSEGEVKIRESKVAQPDLKGDAKRSSDETKDLTVEANTPDNDTKSKDIGGSPSKFKMPTFKMPKIGITTTVNEESSTTSKETEEKLHITKEGEALVITAGSPTKGLKTEASIKGPSVEIKTDAPKASTPDLESPQGETLGSPSKFKLPSFKMPRLSFSKPKAEDEYNADSKIEDNLMESDLKESKSPKKALPSFGDILKNIDVEFDIPSPSEEDMGSPRDDSAAQKQQEPLKETYQEATKSPERTGWFKFPTFGQSSPTDAAKGQVKEDKMASKSPVDLTGNEELSLTCSIQSSEAFADISSTMTSESAGFSLFSPTKVTVKYSDPDSAALIEEMHSKVVMSPTKTEVISVEPNLPEKVTILSSGLSSSSEDTVRLESEKIHVITSNIQVTPESQQAKMLTSFHLQSAEGVSGLESWTLTDSRSSKGTFMESRVVRESSSESKEVVITKQITRVVTTTEPISDETATSIKQLKDSVHTEKMRFFDGAEK